MEKKELTLVRWIDRIMICSAVLSVWFSMPVFFGDDSQGFVYAVYFLAALIMSVVFAAILPRRYLGKHPVLLRILYWFFIINGILTVSIVSGAFLAIVLLAVTGQL